MKKDNSLDLMWCDYCDREVVGYDDIWVCECGAYCTPETSFSWQLNSNKSRELKAKVDELKPKPHLKPKEEYNPDKIKNTPPPETYYNLNRLDIIKSDININDFKYKLKQSVEEELVDTLNQLSSNSNKEDFFNIAKLLSNEVSQTIRKYK